ncbi:hypothetical protein [Lignipirellula cremea]|nr:hypothetical protein [Lignipirellula cremea]
MSTCPRCQQPLPFDLPHCPQCDAPLPSSVPSGLEQRVREMMEKQGKLHAVKLYRDETGASLLEAKNAVDRLAEGKSSFASEANSTEGNAADPSPGDSCEAEVLRLLAAGKGIGAIRHYRQQKGVGLHQARLAVDVIAKRHGVAPPVGSTPGILVFAFLAALAVTAIAGALWLLFG